MLSRKHHTLLPDILLTIQIFCKPRTRISSASLSVPRGTGYEGVGDFIDFTLLQSAAPWCSTPADPYGICHEPEKDTHL